MPFHALAQEFFSVAVEFPRAKPSMKGGRFYNLVGNWEKKDSQCARLSAL